MTPTELRALAAKRRAKLNDRESALTRALDGAADDLERKDAELAKLRAEVGTLLDENGQMHLIIRAARKQVDPVEQFKLIEAMDAALDGREQRVTPAKK